MSRLIDRSPWPRKGRVGYQLPYGRRAAARVNGGHAAPRRRAANDHGIDDPVTEVPDLERAIPARPDGPVMLMSHSPDYADQLVMHPRGSLVDIYKLLCG